jgi:hypothetical protein
MRVHGFFSGIGGFELGFERAGFEVASVCEIEPFCNRVLAKHWPSVPNLGDIQSLQVGSLVRTFPERETVRESQVLGPVFGLTSSESSQQLDLVGLSLRTAQTFEIKDWKRFSGSSLRSGMIRNGIVYPLEPLAPSTLEKGSGLFLRPRSLWEGTDGGSVG